MRDHVLALDQARAASIASDWYQVHRLIHDTVGYRVSGTGPEAPARWQFGADPRAIVSEPTTAAPRFILVRTADDLSGAIEPHSVFSEDTYLPAQGEIVRFFLNVSRKTSRKYDFKELVSRQIPVPGEHPRVTAMKSLSLNLVQKAGLEPIGTLTGPFETGFRVSKPGHTLGTTIKHAVVLSGTATVTDAAQVRAALEYGVGRDRALGFGILIVERLEAVEA